MEDCGRSRVDTLADPEHCGGCGIHRTGGAICDAGLCARPVTFALWGAICRDLTSSVHDCGACDCSCGIGACADILRVCEEEAGLCGGTCPSFQVDEANCGSCGLACPDGVRCRGGCR